MPTCRSCGRVGVVRGKTCACPVVPKDERPALRMLRAHQLRKTPVNQEKVVTTPMPRADRAAVGRMVAADELQSLEHCVGDLLNVEEIHYARGEPTTPGEHQRGRSVIAARERLVQQVRSLGEDARKTVQAEAYWRKSGVRPSHFSTLDLKHERSASAGAIKLDGSRRGASKTDPAAASARRRSKREEEANQEKRDRIARLALAEREVAHDLAREEAGSDISSSAGLTPNADRLAQLAETAGLEHEREGEHRPL